MFNYRSRKSISRVASIGIPATGIAIFLATAPAARGTLIMQVLDSTASAGGTGSFDVVFKETGGASDPVGTFIVDLSVSSGITFTGANVGTSAAPYIFGSIQNPPFTLSSFPNTHCTAGDTDQSLPFEVTLNDGDEAGAAHVNYSVAPGTPSEVVPVTLGSNSYVGDASGGPLDFAISNGTITVTGAATTLPILSLTSTAPTGYGNQITNGASAPDKGTFTGPGAAGNKLTVTGSGGNYIFAQVSGVGTSGNGDASNYVEASGFNPGGDKEVFALDIKVNGTQATPSQITTLLGQINTFGLPSGVSVSSTLTSDPFSSSYNLFLTASPGVAADDFLGFNLSQSNDSSLVGYTASAVAVVPEPFSIGMLAIGGLALMTRRARRGR